MAAITKHFQKISDVECFVKFQGDSGSVTVDLIELVTSHEEIVGIPAVNIAGATCTGTVPGQITLRRNGVIVMTLNSGASPAPDLSGALIPPDNVNNTYPIVATAEFGQCEIWVRLRKVAGYKSKVETAQFGAYDNTTQVGS